MDIKYILYLLNEIKKMDNQYKLYGSFVHKYISNSSLENDEILEFEQLNNIKLPEDYKVFINQVGNGGAGPIYGLDSLEIKKIENLNKPCRLKLDMSDEEWNVIITDKKLLFHINNTIEGKGCLPVVMQDMNKIINLNLSKKLDYNSFETMYDMSNVYDISSLVYAKRICKQVKEF